MLAYHSEIVANLSSLVRNILKLENFGSLNLFTTKNSQIFITLAEVNPITLRIIMDSIYTRDVINFSSFNSVGIQSIIKQLGVSEELFSVAEVGQADVEDSQIVDVISDLMEEFNTNPQQSEKDLQEMLVNNLGDGFLTNISDSTTIDAGDDFFGLENLMAESGDDDVDFEQATVEEIVPGHNVENKLNVSFQADEVPDMPDIHLKYDHDASKDMTVKKCFVEISNIPNDTLKHYINIAQDNLAKSVKRRPEADTELSRRKRRKNLSQDFEYEEVDESLKSRNDPVIEVSSENGPNPILIPEETFENRPKARTLPEQNLVIPAIPPPVSAPETDTAEIQFVEAKQVSCMICQEVFKVRSKIIQHLCVSHFSNQIFALYPFVKGGSCLICVKAGKAKPTQLRDKNAHVRHIGQAHEIIFEIITPEFRETIDQFAKTSKRAPPKYRVKEEKVEVVDQVEESNSSFQESPEDNYMKLLKDFTENYESSPKLPDESLGESSSSLNTTVESVQDDTLFSQSDQTLLDKYCIEVDDTKPETETPVAKSVSCSLCPDQVSFKFRPHILTHLSYQHLSKELLALYPFEEGKACEICSEKGKSNSKDHANHIGSFHEKVLDLLPEDFCTRIDEMPRGRSRTSERTSSVLETSSGFKPDLNSTFLEKEFDVENKGNTSQPDSDCDLCNLAGTPSRSDLLLHYATKHFQQQILKSFPFQESMPCKLCVEKSNPKAFVAKSAFRHLKHIGVMHEKALNFMSSSAKIKLEAKFSIKKKISNFSPEAFSASILKNVTIPKTNNPTVLFSCKLCVKSFVNEDELNTHKITHKEGRNYNCRYCGQTSDNAKQFKLHLLSHKNELSKAKLS